MARQVVVIGLGQFGLGLIRALSQTDTEIIAVDSNEKIVEMASSWVSKAMCFDATNEEALAQIQPGIRDVCVCATGDQSKEVGIICTALLKQLGAKRVISRANDELHARILKLVGADEVVNPEWDFGARFAPRILNQHVLGEMLLDSELVISEFVAPKNLCGKSLADLNLRNKYDISIIALKSKSSGQVIQAGPQNLIEEGDILISASSREAIRELVEKEDE
ncbi:MAG: TrkA family potassium uptake protein [Bdellovibrionota bacterium]|nr:TrkA family potassium uptake protein [Bdellovibrionota bacterium]